MSETEFEWVEIKARDGDEILKVLRYKAGYQVITMSHEHPGDMNKKIEIRSAFTHDGHYIGDPKTAKFLYDKGLVQVQPAAAIHKRKGSGEDANGGWGFTCSLAFHPVEKKWYGWSHRAMFGFGVGDVVKKGDVVNSSGWTDEWLKEHPEDDTSLPVGFTAKTLDDAKTMAIAFAEGVA